MTLAQVVYQISTDADFASQLFSNPEVALARKGLELSREELAFLSSVHGQNKNDKVQIATFAKEKASNWRG